MENENLSQKSPERLKIIKKIELFEQNGWFDQDVEDDPPTKPLLPQDVDYTYKKFGSKIHSKISYRMALNFLNKMLKSRQIIIDDVIGISNLQLAKNSGAILTCNHFNPFDNFAVQYAFRKAKLRHKKLFTVIREGNYTNFPGFYGYLMHNCYTLPLSSCTQTMKDFLNGMSHWLAKKQYVLVYPEQSMWWNYKKPKPLKKSAFSIACNNNVPVIPIFVTMKDSDVLDADGFFVQRYTIHIGAPIYAQQTLPKSERVQDMMDKNFNFWKECYETAYGKKLEYTTKQNLSANGKTEQTEQTFCEENAHTIKKCATA